MFLGIILLGLGINIVLIAVLPSEDGNKLHKGIRYMTWLVGCICVVMFSYYEYEESIERSKYYMESRDE